MSNFNRWLETNEPALRLAFRVVVLVILYLGLDDIALMISHLDTTLNYMR